MRQRQDARRPSRVRSSSESAAAERALDSRLSCESATPLGTPVVPDV